MRSHDPRTDPTIPRSPMIPTTPHRSLMLLHRLVDRALAPLLAPMELEHATEDYVMVTRDDIEGLVDTHDDPQSVLAGFGPRATTSGVLVAEPALSSAILSRIWRSNRNEGAPLTQVEGEILRQFLARLVGAWATAWADEGIQLVPEFSMAGALSTIEPQLADGTWHVARTVVRASGSSTPIGVLLFCYPTLLMPQLEQQARSILWRSRVERGLNERDRTALQERLAGPLRNLVITAPVTVHQHVTLGMLDSLERGDIVAFDTDARGAISFDVLGREIAGRLARSGESLAIVLDAAVGEGAHAPDPVGAVAGSGSAPGPALGFDDQPPAPPDGWDALAPAS